MKYLAVVAGEAILGANLFKDIFAGIRDIVGGRSGAYEKELKNAISDANRDYEEKARAQKACEPGSIVKAPRTIKILNLQNI